MEHTVLMAIIGLYGAIVLLGIILGSIMVSGFRKNADADRVIGERISMQMAESSGLMKEMGRKTDEMSRKTDEMIKEMAQEHKETGVFLRMILERVDKNR